MAKRDANEVESVSSKKAFLKDVTAGMFRSIAPATSNTMQSARSVMFDFRRLSRRLSSTQERMVDHGAESTTGQRRANDTFSKAMSDISSGDFGISKTNDSLYEDYGDIEKGFDPDSMTADERAEMSAEEMQLAGSRGIARAVIRSSSAQLEGLAQINRIATKTQLQAAQATARAINASISYQTKVLSSQIMVTNTKLDQVNANLRSLLEYQNVNTTKYYTDSLKMINAMGKMMQNMTKLSTPKEAKALRNYDASGGFNIKDYIDHVKSNFEKSMLGSVVTMGKTLGDFRTGGGLSFEGGLPGIIGSVIGTFLLPKNLRESAGRFDKHLGRNINALLQRLGDIGTNNPNSWFNMLGLGEILGNKRISTGKLDMSQYHKDALPWNGKAQKALTEVIPELLTSIDAGINRTDKRYFDYDKGVWNSRGELSEQMRKDFQNIIAANTAGFSSNLTRLMDSQRVSTDKQDKVLSEVSKWMEDLAKGKVKQDSEGLQRLYDVIKANSGMSDRYIAQSMRHAQDSGDALMTELTNMLQRIGSTDSKYSVINNRSSANRRKASGKEEVISYFNEDWGDILTKGFSTDVDQMIKVVEQSLRQMLPNFRMNSKYRQVVMEGVANGDNPVQITNQIRYLLISEDKIGTGWRAAKAAFRTVRTRGARPWNWEEIIKLDELDPESTYYSPTDGYIDRDYLIARRMRNGIRRGAAGVSSVIDRADSEFYYRAAGINRHRSSVNSSSAMGDTTLTNRRASSNRSRSDGVVAGAEVAHGPQNNNSEMTLGDDAQRYMSSANDIMMVDPRTVLENGPNSIRNQTRVLENGAKIITSLAQSEPTSTAQRTGNLLTSLTLFVSNIATSFQLGVTRIFGKDGIIGQFFQSDQMKEAMTKLKSYLFDEETGVFGNQVKWLKAKGKDLWSRTKDQLLEGYDWVYTQYNRGVYGDDFRENEHWKNNKWAQRLDLKAKRDAKRKAKEAAEAQDTATAQLEDIPALPPADASTGKGSTYTPTGGPSDLLSLPPVKSSSHTSQADTSQDKSAPHTSTQTSTHTETPESKQGSVKTGSKTSPTSSAKLSDGKGYFKLLGIAPTESAEEIKKAYRAKAREYHPDLVQDENLKKLYSDKMAEINQVYEILEDAEKRTQYLSGAISLPESKNKSRAKRSTTSNSTALVEYDAKAAADSKAVTAAANSITNDLKKRGIIPKAFATGITGAGLGLLNTIGGPSLLGTMLLPGGPIAGAIAGISFGLLSQTEAFKSVMFGKINPETGEREGGLISKKLRDSFKKTAPTIVKGAVSGAVLSILKTPLTGGKGLGILGMQILPGGILGGAITGMALGMLKNNETFMSHVFGKKDENGKRSGTWLSKMYNSFSEKKFGKDMKKRLGAAAKGAGVGALTGTMLSSMGFFPAMLSVGGPVGMSIAGLGVGIASTTKHFNEWLFGKEELDADGNPTGKKTSGFLDRIRNIFTVNVVDPIKTAFKDNMVRFIDWTKDKITEPFRLVFGPIVDGFKSIKGNIEDFVKDRFNEIGEGVKTVLTKSIKAVFSPITKLIGGIGQALMGATRIGLQTVGLGLSVPLKGLELLTMGKRRKVYKEYRNIHKATYKDKLQENWDKREAEGKKIGFWQKASERFDAWRGRGEVADEIRQEFARGATERGLNFANWLNVYSDRQKRKNDMKKWKVSARKWKRIDKIRQSIATNDLGGRELDLTPVQIKEYQKLFTEAGVSERLLQGDKEKGITESDRLMELIYHKQDFINRAGGKSKGIQSGEVNAIGEYFRDMTLPMLEAHNKEMKATEKYRKDMLGGVSEITKLIRDMTDDAFDRINYSSFQESQNQSRHRLNKWLSSYPKNAVGSKDYKKKYKAFVNSIDLYNADFEGINLRNVTREMLETFFDSSTTDDSGVPYFNLESEDPTKDFYKFLMHYDALNPEANLEMKPKTSTKEARHKAEAEEREAARLRMREDLLNNDEIKDEYYKAAQKGELKLDKVSYLDWLTEKFPEVFKVIEEISKDVKAGNETREDQAKLTKDQAETEKKKDEADRAEAKGFRAFFQRFLQSQRITQLKEKAKEKTKGWFSWFKGKEKSESDEATALDDGKGSVNESESKEESSEEKSEEKGEKKQNIFSKIFGGIFGGAKTVIGGIGSLFGKFANTKIGGLIVKGVKLAGGIGLLSGLGLTIMETINPGTADKIGASIANFNKEVDPNNPNGNLFDRFIEWMKKTFKGAIDWVTNDFLGSDGYLAKFGNKLLDFLPGVISTGAELSIKGITTAADFIVTHAETLINTVGKIVETIGPPLAEAIASTLPKLITSFGSGLWKGITNQTPKKSGEQHLNANQTASIVAQGGGYQDNWIAATPEEAQEAANQGFEVAQAEDGTYMINDAYTLDSNIVYVDENGKAHKGVSKKGNATINFLGKTLANFATGRSGVAKTMLGSAAKTVVRGGGMMLGGTAGLVTGGPLGAITGGKLGYKAGKLVDKGTSKLYNFGKSIFGGGAKVAEEAAEEAVKNGGKAAGKAAVNASTKALAGQMTLEGWEAGAKAAADLADDGTSAVINMINSSGTKALAQASDNLADAAETFIKNEAKGGGGILSTMKNSLMKHVQQAIDFLKGIADKPFVKKIVESKAGTFGGKVIKGIKNAFGKFIDLISSAFKKIVSKSELLTDVSNYFTEKVGVGAAKDAVGAATLGISTLVMTIGSAVVGGCDAPNLFGVAKSECDWKMRLIAALIEGLLSLSGIIGAIIEGIFFGVQLVSNFSCKKWIAEELYKAISALCDEDGEAKLKKGEDKLALACAIYNEENGMNMSVEEFNEVANKGYGAKLLSTVTFGVFGGKNINVDKYLKMADERYDSGYRADSNGNVTRAGSTYKDTTIAGKNSLGYGLGPLGFGTSDEDQPLGMYSQSNPAWANRIIGTFPNGQPSTMATGGCGPTAMAVAMSELLGKPVNPSRMADYAISNGYISQGGANAGLFTVGASRLGANSSPVDKHDLTRALATNRPTVISGQGSGVYTKAGHIVVARGLDEDGNTVVMDPQSGRNSVVSVNTLKRGYKRGWNYSMGYGDAPNDYIIAPMGYGSWTAATDCHTDNSVAYTPEFQAKLDKEDADAKRKADEEKALQDEIDKCSPGKGFVRPCSPDHPLDEYHSEVIYVSKEDPPNLKAGNLLYKFENGVYKADITDNPFNLPEKITWESLVNPNNTSRYDTRSAALLEPNDPIHWMWDDYAGDHWHLYNNFDDVANAKINYAAESERIANKIAAGKGGPEDYDKLEKYNTKLSYIENREPFLNNIASGKGTSEDYHKLKQYNLLLYGDPNQRDDQRDVKSIRLKFMNPMIDMSTVTVKHQELPDLPSWTFDPETNSYIQNYSKSQDAAFIKYDDIANPDNHKKITQFTGYQYSRMADAYQVPLPASSSLYKWVAFSPVNELNASDAWVENSDGSALLTIPNYTYNQETNRYEINPNVLPSTKLRGRDGHMVNITDDEYKQYLHFTNDEAVAGTANIYGLEYRPGNKFWIDTDSTDGIANIYKFQDQIPFNIDFGSPSDTPMEEDSSYAAVEAAINGSAVWTKDMVFSHISHSKGFIQKMQAIGRLLKAYVESIKNGTDPWAEYGNLVEETREEGNDPSVSSYTQTYDPSKSADTIWQFLNQRFGPYGAAGIMGCWECESHNTPERVEADYLFLKDKPVSSLATKAQFTEYTQKLLQQYKDQNISVDAEAYNGENGGQYPGLGLAQWTGKRADRLVEFAKEHNMNWWDLATQLLYFQDEVSRSYRSLPGELLAAKNTKDATRAAYDIYEMSKGAFDKSDQPGGRGYNRAVQAALIYDRYKQQQIDDAAAADAQLNELETNTEASSAEDRSEIMPITVDDATLNVASTTTPTPASASSMLVGQSWYNPNVFYQNTTDPVTQSRMQLESGVSRLLQKPVSLDQSNQNTPEGAGIGPIGFGQGPVGYGPKSSGFISGLNAVGEALANKVSNLMGIETTNSSNNTNSSGVYREIGTKEGNSTQKALVDKMKSIEGTLTYSLDGDKQDPDKGYGSCASTVSWAYRKVFGNTDQFTSNRMSASSTESSQDARFDTVYKKTRPNQVLDTSILQPGDVMYQHWANATGYTGVWTPGHMSHTELWAGDNQAWSHGSSTTKGPTLKKYTHNGGTYDRINNTMIVRRYKGFMRPGSAVGYGPADSLTEGMNSIANAIGYRLYQITGDDSFIAGTNSSNTTTNATTATTGSISYGSINTSNVSRDTANLLATGPTAFFNAIANERGIRFNVSSKFGRRKNPTASGTQFHRGIDYAMPAGTAIYSPVEGTVKTNLWDNSRGWYVVVTDVNNADHYFQHLISKSTLNTGDHINIGDLIGYVGSTGASTGPHLHYGIRVLNPADYPAPTDSSFINPEDYIYPNTNNLNGMGGDTRLDMKSILNSSIIEPPKTLIVNDRPKSVSKYHQHDKSVGYGSGQTTATDMHGTEERLDKIFDLMSEWYLAEKAKIPSTSSNQTNVVAKTTNVVNQKPAASKPKVKSQHETLLNKHALFAQV